MNNLTKIEVKTNMVIGHITVNEKALVFVPASGVDIEISDLLAINEGFELAQKLGLPIKEDKPTKPHEEIMADKVIKVFNNKGFQVKSIKSFLSVLNIDHVDMAELVLNNEFIDVLKDNNIFIDILLTPVGISPVFIKIV